MMTTTMTTMMTDSDPDLDDADIERDDDQERDDDPDESPKLIESSEEETMTTQSVNQANGVPAESYSRNIFGRANGILLAQYFRSR
jgi:hypothetical protein